MDFNSFRKILIASISKDFNVSMVSNRFQWISMNFDGFQQKDQGFHLISMEIHVFQYVAMDFNGFQWISNGFHFKAFV